MKVLFVAGFSPISRDSLSSRSFYVDALGLPLDKSVNDYIYTDGLDGTKHFGVWPLSEAAEACFGSSVWPSDTDVPQATLELEVDDVEGAASELVAKGLKLIHGKKTEPWGQVVARLLSPEGLLIGLCHTPWLHHT